MLKEIFCDKFKVNGKDGQVRPPIQFKTGLNVIEGADSGSNSIGKSTFLMVIDFCFGGNDYIDILTDVKKHVGDHVIYFTFQFEKPYHFARKTDESKFIYICDIPHVITERKVSLNEFNQFLKEKYEIPIMDLTFRAITGRFMRIYNRQNLNELLPLRAYENETEKASILEMVKLYNLYAPLVEIAKASDEASEKYDVYNKSQNYRYIPKINKTEYEKNKKNISNLRIELSELEEKSERNLIEIPVEKAELTADLRDQITYLKRKRGKLFNQLNAYKQDAEFELKGLNNDFSDLTQFFNNIEIEKIEAIELFHKQLGTILKTEIKKSKSEIYSEINLLSEAIKSLEDQVASIEQTSGISKIVLKSYSKLERQIDDLQKENDCYEKMNLLKNDAEEKEKILKEETAKQTDSLINTINLKMANINKNYYANKTNAPVLSMPTPNKYNFTTPDDQGTGCRYKSMITLDVAILTSTSLPVIIHDSVMFVQMDYERVQQTLNLYNQINNKQIFVAIDRTTNLDEKSRVIIDASKTLDLQPNGGELFGWYWGAPKEIKND